MGAAISWALDVCYHLISVTKDSRTTNSNQQIQRWKRPPCNTLKVNVDGAFAADNNSGAIGAVARDDAGMFLMAVSRRLPVVASALAAEAEALRAGIAQVSSENVDHHPHPEDMKLLIDAKAMRVVFAEADKDVVDFLFSLLSLPVATIVKMLGKSSMPGTFGNLYGSVEKLDCTYVVPGVDKKAVLWPTMVPSAANTTRSSLLLPVPSSGQPRSFFQCRTSNGSGCCEYVTDTKGTRCPSCRNDMRVPLKFVPPEGDGSGNVVPTASSTGAAKGFVKEVVTYTVRDDLTVTPMSTISSITLLNTGGVTDFSALLEKTVRLGYAHAGPDFLGLEIVKASLQSKTVLTDVYLGNKRPRGCA
ncbi:uncharacterized protein LOC120674488 [Panicum virgatum]|uniref:uncharacterized protein LOC120674488 n=1 Tax=Panicum virgatum TaxID=38727 RepID=UPI0019D53F0A|nr:uncharacterized protein LOC120674488 [Panicum virgatum]